MLKYENGDLYNGMWQEGEKHGFGIFIWASGEKFEGFWSEDLKHGYAIMNFDDGDS